ncbi:MAG: YidC/Oxa1 family membrane protein insertase [Candidatus Yanofskybacteria bacterium]|nr:YidC/Oxa1 family membrane protein insertase [Candidatus Yanofskybacteria bacterium]
MIDFFGSIFNTLLTAPLLNALVFLYGIIPGQDLGIAIIVLTIGIRILFYPLADKAARSQLALAELQPKMKEVKEKFKDDRQKQAQAIMELYKKEGVNPFAGVLPLLIQLPVLIAVYRLFWNGLGTGEITGKLYPFIANPGVIEPTLLGILDLSQGSLVLAGIAGVLQFVQSKQMAPSLKGEKKAGALDFADMMRKQTLFVFPLIIAYIVVMFPSAIGLYLITTLVFSIWQQARITKKQKPA